MPSSHPLPKNLDRLKALIGTPSVSSIDSDYDMGNLPVIELLANWLDPLGFKTTIQPVSKGKANLIARIGEGQGGLVLSGHTDTVPYNADRWQSDPFSLTERENKFFGLGACDMKGFFSLAIEASLRFSGPKIK
jgi:acetylornithine deacetylase